MLYEIRYSTLSISDLDNIWNDVYEASKDFDTADNYTESIIDIILEKRAFPNTGIPLVYRGLFTGFYSLNYKKHKVFYRVKDGYIEVSRILFSKSNYMEVLFGKGE